MATITIELSDAIIADFYEAVGAFPDSSWTAEEKQLWLRTMHLEPFIHKSLIQAGDYVRRTRAVEAATQQADAEQKTIEDTAEAERQARAQRLPAKLRATR